MRAMPVLAALFAAAVSLSPVFAAGTALPVPKTVEEAYRRSIDKEALNAEAVVFGARKGPSLP